MRTSVLEWIDCPSKKKREEGKRIIREVIIPRVNSSWWNGRMNGGDYCPITAIPFRIDVNVNSFIHERMDRAAGGNIIKFNDSHTKEEVLEVLKKAAE